MLLTAAAPVERARATKGSEAPAVEISGESGEVSLAGLRGKYVIVNFWNSADPQSRIDNALYDRAFSCKNSPEVVCISICTDSDREVFAQILKADALQSEHQYFHEDSRLSDLMAEYSPVGTSVAYLIGPDGRVEALNPGVDYVKNLANGLAG